MDRMNERYAPVMAVVPMSRLEQLLKTEAMMEAMLAEYDRSEFHIIGGGTVANAKAVVYGIVEDEADA